MGNLQSPIENLSGAPAIEKIRGIAEKTGIFFFSTRVGVNTQSRPMALQAVDEGRELWFLSDLTLMKIIKSKRICMWNCTL